MIENLRDAAELLASMSRHGTAESVAMTGEYAHSFALAVLALLDAQAGDRSFPFGSDARSAWESRPKHERTLRMLLAGAYSGTSHLYGDDGELQDNRRPCIDYVRNSVAEIEAAIAERGQSATRRTAGMSLAARLREQADELERDA